MTEILHNAEFNFGNFCGQLLKPAQNYVYLSVFSASLHIIPRKCYDGLNGFTRFGQKSLHFFPSVNEKKRKSKSKTKVNNETAKPEVSEHY